MTSPRDLGSPRSDRVFWWILGVAGVFSLAYNGVILIGFGPDETRHMNYITLLLDAGRLPVIENADPQNYRETAGAHAFHPPLYYAILLPFYAAFRALPGDLAWHLTRAASSLFCLASLPLLYQIAFVASNERRDIARLVAATVAFVPIWGMTAGIINNDAPALFFTSLFLWLLLVRFAGKLDVRKALILGVVLGLGGLCKATTLLCGGGALLLAIWAQRKTDAPIPKVAWLTLATGALLVAPWHARSFNLYGTRTPLPPAAPWFSPPLRGLELWLHPDFPAIFARCNVSLFTTLWSQRDWLWQRQTRTIGEYETPQLIIYSVLALFCALAILGYGRKSKLDSPDSHAAKTARLASYGAFVLTWLTVLQVAFRCIKAGPKADVICCRRLAGSRCFWRSAGANCSVSARFNGSARFGLARNQPQFRGAGVVAVVFKPNLRPEISDVHRQDVSSTKPFQSSTISKSTSCLKPKKSSW
jgi:hypothetical protein